MTLLAVSVGLFMFWGGLLWRAPREASQLGRFVVSYLAVVPLAALLLIAVSRFTWGRLTTAVGTLWALKLVITAALYMAVAGVRPSRAPRVLGAAPQPTRSAPLHGYVAGALGFASGAVAGVVRLGGKPVEGALIWLDEPPPGLAATRLPAASLSIEHGRQLPPVLLASAGSALTTHNLDPILHTVRVASVDAVPLPPSQVAQTLELPEEAGLHVVTCDNHTAERSQLLILDHPYVTFSAADGSFRIADAPIGRLRVRVVAEAGASEQVIDLGAGAEASVTLELVP